ncbi:MAG: zinc-binding dehydrogenase, partial [Allorhizobium sp.]
GANMVVNGTAADAIDQVQKATGGVHGALVTAVSPKAMEQAYGFLRSKGTMSLVGLPPGFISLPVFETVLKRITVRGSIVGTRQDLEESLQFAGEGKVASHFSWDRLENINAIFDRMKEGKIDGRIVLDLAD